MEPCWLITDRSYSDLGISTFVCTVSIFRKSCKHIGYMGLVLRHNPTKCIIIGSVFVLLTEYLIHLIQISVVSFGTVVRTVEVSNNLTIVYDIDYESEFLVFGN